MAQPNAAGRELTGRRVLLYLVAFFIVVSAVNALMIRAATSTFGGVETASPYNSGLAFGHEIEAAAAQDGRHWTVDGRLTRGAGGYELAVTVRDRSGAPVSGATLDLHLVHPADARRDRAVAMTETATGVFKGRFESAPGLWYVSMELTRDTERLFKSRSRLVLQ